MLADRTIRDLLGALASAAPTPGGGTASAVASAMGASLLMMVAALPKTRSNSQEDRTALDAAAGALTGLQQQLTDAIDLDAAAYDQVLAAYKLPKATEGDRAARAVAIQRALRGATEVPLDVMRLSARALGVAGAVARHGSRAAASDVGVAVALLAAGLRGARLNVEINLGGLGDAEFVEAVTLEAGHLAGDAEAAAAALA
jgi:methenyltetrahydrofolate cyclohydrolase